MQPQFINPNDIQARADFNQRNKDLFDILLDQNFASAMPIYRDNLSTYGRIIEQEKQEIQQIHQVIEERRQNQGCKCTKIDCLKLYCQCFARGRICNENCICVCCKNKSHNQQQIYHAQRIANYRNPGFFKNIPPIVPGRKCTCKKSQCRKKYCECFNAGQKCSQQCECFGCQNGKCQSHKDDYIFKNRMEIEVHA